MSAHPGAFLITGGTRGIGRALALRLAAGGSTVLLTYRADDEAAHRAVADVEAAGGRAITIRSDLRDPEGAEPIVARVAGEVDHLDGFVANAASSAFKPLDQIGPHHVEKTMTMTMTNFLALAQGVLPQLSPGGRILAVSGWDSFRMLPGHGLLGAAKAALEASVRYLALELADRHVTAVGIAPGPVDTDSFRIYGGSQWDDYNAEWTARTPLGHIATAEDLAPVLEFLLSPAAAWFNGQTLVADGGLSLATMAPSLAAGARR